MKKTSNPFSFAFTLGLIAFALVFFLNWSVNLLFTAFLRGSAAFLIFFLVGYLSYFIIFQLGTEKTRKPAGKRINLSTSTQQNDLDLNEIFNTTNGSDHANDHSIENAFEPLEFKRMEVNDGVMETRENSVEELVKGVRTFVEK